MYPRIVINTKNILENSRKMVALAKDNHIDYVMAIVKVFSGHFDFIDELIKTGITHIGDSRIQNLKKLNKISLPKILVRIPMLSETSEVVQYSDISLNSELETIKKLNDDAKKANKKHQIILMFDLGDLREGYYHSQDYLKDIEEILKLENINLLGIGTNLTCYGGLVPGKEILNRLVKIKNKIEAHFNMRLKIISGGNSSTVTLFGKNEIPKEINSLRLGESIFFGKETSYSKDIQGFNHDNYVLEAEIIECKMKPSFPEGKTSINSFGEKVDIEDKGMMKRAICAIGKQDVILNNLSPIDANISVIGGSSDHLILDVTNTEYKVGDIISFNVNYPGLLHLMNSDYVYKFFK
ncbi:MAG: alanine/ornithine racemase family PLP-dependent enzyme [Tenericutes bacterium]|jgi:predicted amino acid racemase|nr:alanine/ornithine racemase family PLP-dependent enzyme [Mycoplasmatota bacterium]